LATPEGRSVGVSNHEDKAVDHEVIKRDHEFADAD
jgi:hypothetical protein